MMNALRAPGNRSAKEELLFYKRSRIPVKSVYRNAVFASEINEFLSAIEGVKQASANPLTGKVLVIYDEDIIDEISITEQINSYLIGRNTTKNTNLIKMKSPHYTEEFSSCVAIEATDSLFEKYNFSSVTESSGSFWHSMHSNELQSMLKTNLKNGLRTGEAEEKLQEFGLNVLSEKKRKSLMGRFIENLQQFSSKLLLGVSFISFLLRQIPDAVAVLGIVLLETALSTAQQHKSEESLHSLKNIMVNKSKVIRSGKEQLIDAKYLVPGDIILVEAGDKVPADARIVEAFDLKISEASLTGESIPVIKVPKRCIPLTELGNRNNMLYMGTNVMCGRGRAVVVATGMKTEIGKIAAMLQSIKIEATPLQLKMQRFTNKLTKLCLLACLLIGTGGLIMGRSLGQVLTMGVSFALGALPESLPAVVTVAMALSVQRIARHNAIVRKLPAVETLGSANVICCDKTGTLTMNEMTVRRIYTDNCLYEVSGSGYSPEGGIKLIEGNHHKSDSLEKLLTTGIVCNTASLIYSGKNWSIQGDPTEGALITAARKYRLNEYIVREANHRVKEIPFNSDTKYMTVVADCEEDRIAYCKGALDAIMSKCTTIYEDGCERLFTSSDRERLNKVCNRMGESALRVLALAYKRIRKVPEGKEEFEHNYVFLGLAGMEDPPRKGVKRSIEKCHKAGIKVIMITGDHKNTAAAIGRQIGLLTNGLVISGNELDAMTQEELDAKVQKIQIFAMTSPVQKLRIVKALKRFGFIVAMTGDGVNDAPAIKEANIGIAMGCHGSDVAKDAAAITLVDDDFSTIVKAIQEGRAVTKNVRNAMKYLLAGGLGEILTLGLCGAFGGFLPLISLQILWINVISESILGCCLAAEPGCENVMDEPPVKAYEPLINRKLGIQIVRRGIGIGITTFALFKGSLLMGASIVRARTLAYTNLISSQLVNVYRCRSTKHRFPHEYMNIAVIAAIVLLLGTVYLPFLNPFFGTQALGLIDWAGVAAASLLSSI